MPCCRSYPMDNTPFGNFCLLNLVITTILLSSFFFLAMVHLMLYNCFGTSFSSTSFSSLACALSKTVCSTFLKYLKTAMITLYRLLLECVLEKQSRTKKDIFNYICNARVAIFQAICALQMLSFSESLSISKTRHNDGWGKMFRLWKYYEIVYLTCDASACNRSLKCSVPASKNHHGWNECTKIA